MISVAVNVVTSILWHPLLSERYKSVERQTAINGLLKRHVERLQQLLQLREEREDFANLDLLISGDKNVMEEKMEKIESHLAEKRSKFIELEKLRLPICALKSDISLLLSNFARCNKNYILYNNILGTIHAILSDTDISEKMAHQCGTLKRAESIQSGSLGVAEETMHTLL